MIVVGHRPLIRSIASESRAPCTVIFETGESSFAELMGVGSTSTAPMFSSSRSSAEGNKIFAHPFFVRERAVSFGRVEENDAAFYRRPDEGDLLFICSQFICSQTVAVPHSLAAET
jgi:hypothetical protein